ncbi:Na(+)-translocating NADH-quinone reductase subunit C [Rhabdobacter roseus]|uniref:Na(+)-translocating NADH-quinone reductase subunit C n=1 Tax=Rhabdobacter roseus TaxID=1655419 RepID=A0A840TR09_9BACT|nr:Na+-transporting NADH:ubiquinone oxidoreductase subunit C [Rhabdobacter roseus]
MHSNQYTFLFAIGISLFTALLLSVMAVSLKPRQQANEALDRKSNILQALRLSSDDPESIEKLYNERVEEMVVSAEGKSLDGEEPADVDLRKEVMKPAEQRRLPLYIYKDDKDRSFYVVPVHGNGLWGPVWGFVALEDDFNTIYGANFDHKSETPGLGAEISEYAFQQQFEGKKLLDEQEKFVSVRVTKPGEAGRYPAEHRVDAISGGTITSRGVDAMLQRCIEPYYTYFSTLKNE